MPISLCCTRALLDPLELGLHIQHGRECCCGDRPESDVELVQLQSVQEAEQDMGYVAWSYRRVAGYGDEFGVVGFSALVGHD